MTAYQTYLAGLPQKRMGAGCLFMDTAQRLLIVKPTYRDGWLIPGGVIEANESPRQACIREVKEELGISCQPTNLLCVDYVNHNDNYGESLQFVFASSVLDISKIVLAERELSHYQFASIEDALTKLGESTQRRIFWSMEALKIGETLYLENHEPV
ncbi:MAG: NUDIX hydrolase [Cyanobacteria bacterium J06648_10]